MTNEKKKETQIEGGEGRSVAGSVLITGVRGFVGSSLSNYLRRESEIPICGSSRKKERIEHLRDKLDGIYSFDEIFEKKLSFENYVHLSGKVYDFREKSNEDEYYQANYEKTKELFDHFLNDPAARKFIFLSTIHVLTENPEKELDEEYQPEPFTPYGKSKFLAENYITENLPEEKDAYILRPSMIHGPGNKGNLNLLFKLVQSGIPYPIGAINNRRSFVSIENLCFILKEIITQKIPSGLYHIADDEPTYTHDLVRMIARNTGKKARILNINIRLLELLAKAGNHLPIPLNEHRLTKLTGDFIVSNRKIKDAINKPLPVTAEEGLLRTLESLTDSL